MSVPGSGAPVRPSVTYPRTEWDRGGRFRSRYVVPGPHTYVDVEVGAWPGASATISAVPDWTWIE